jgi:uncharacterized protein DUF4268
MTIGKLVRVPLREVWKHEALDFTAWMEQNIETLSEVLDINLVSAEREQAAGDFSVDLIAEDDQGRNVIVENQLEASDHKHLGQVITYLTAVDAYAAIWVVSRARMEHIKAVSWLNEATSTPFYLVQVEAVRIEGSAPAALFTLIVGPSIEAQAAGKTKKEFGARESKRHQFWTELLDHAKGETKLHATRSPRASGWIRAGAGINRVYLTYVVRQHDTQVELYIDPGDADTNRAIFDGFHDNREQIEAAFGAPLEWQFLEGKRACRIRHRLSLGGWKDPDSWPTVIEKTVDAMVRLESALREPLRKLKAAQR